MIATLEAALGTEMRLNGPYVVAEGGTAEDRGNCQAPISTAGTAAPLLYVSSDPRVRGSPHRRTGLARRRRTGLTRRHRCGHRAASAAAALGVPGQDVGSGESG